MLYSIKKLSGSTIKATDGELGKLSEFYFDDESWTIRYSVVQTGSWLTEKKVLISTIAFGKPGWLTHSFSVNISCEQIRNSPDIDTEMPVYRQHEAELHHYYQWPVYWQTDYGSPFGLQQVALYDNVELQKLDKAKKGDPHLRSTRELTGYQIHATDGNIGHITDFLVDDVTWQIRFMVVDIGKWLPGRHVILSPKWIDTINWEESNVVFSLSQEAIRNSPDYDPFKTVSEDYEENLHDHYGRPLDDY